MAEDILYFKVDTRLGAERGVALGGPGPGGLPRLCLPPDVDVVYFWHVGGRRHRVRVLETIHRVLIN